MAKGPKFGFYYAVAAIPVLGAGIVGPDVFHASEEVKRIAFVACLVMAIVCVTIGAIKERAEERRNEALPGHRRRMVALIGMWVCGLGFVGFAAGYFWPSSKPPVIDETTGMPGISVHSVIKLGYSPNQKRQYIFDVTLKSGAGLSFYLSASDHFTLAAKDIRGEVYTFEAGEAARDIPVGEFIYLVCGVRQLGDNSELFMSVNEGEPFVRHLPFFINIGDFDLLKSTLGASDKKTDFGTFMLAEFWVYSGVPNSREQKGLALWVADKSESK